MKQVLRESLWLLSGGQYLSFLDEREPLTEVALTYADFAVLRPELSASSWRGAMLKAQERGWVYKRLVSGLTTFQLTKMGREAVAADFLPLRQFLGGKRAVSVLAVKAGRSVTPRDVSGAKTWIVEAGGESLSTGLWAFPGANVPEWVLSRLHRVGFLTLAMNPFQGGAGRSLSLSAWKPDGGGEGVSARLARLEGISSNMDALLDLLQTEKKLHHLQNAQIGKNSVRILSELRELRWIHLEDSSLQDALFRALQACDQVLVEWVRHQSSF